MNQYEENFYHTIIKRTFPDASNIRKPDVLGWVANAIYIIDTNNKTLVCKFNKKEIILHNEYVSNLLNYHNISIPKTTAHSLYGTWFETYTYRPEKTLHQLIQEGLSDEHIFTAYKKALEIQNKISQIDISNLSIPYCPRFIDIIKCYKNSSLYRKIFYSTSVFGKQHLLHNDIYPRNILYSPETQEVSLIDIDSISTSNFIIPAISFLHHYPCKNYDKLAQEYQNSTGHKLNIPLLRIANKTLNTPSAIKHKIIDVAKRFNNLLTPCNFI